MTPDQRKEMEEAAKKRADEIEGYRDRKWTSSVKSYIAGYEKAMEKLEAQQLHDVERELEHSDRLRAIVDQRDNELSELRSRIAVLEGVLNKIYKELEDPHIPYTCTHLDPESKNPHFNDVCISRKIAGEALSSSPSEGLAAIREAIRDLKSYKSSACHYYDLTIKSLEKQFGEA